MNLFVHYPKCSTCQKAKRWLEEQGVQFEERDIVKDNPTAQELCTWAAKGNVPVKKLFNTSGLLYRAANLKDKLPDMSETEQFEILSTDGMLVKRPLVVGEDFLLVGFRPKEWESALATKESE